MMTSLTRPRLRTAARAYRAILRQQMLAGLQYRAGYWGKMINYRFWGYVQAMLLWIFYTWGQGDAALTLSQAISMTWLTQIAGHLLPGWGMDFTVWNKISSGEVGYELTRPLDIYGHWYMNAIAVKLSPFLMSILPTVVAAMLLPGDIKLLPPVSLPHLLACLFTLCTGLLLSCTAICMSYAMLMDVRVGSAPGSLFMTVVQILAGSVLPLQLWPDWMQRILYYQPFAGILDIPFRFYVGTAPLSDLARVLPMQLAWILILGFLGRRWIMASLRKLVVQGG